MSKPLIWLACFVVGGLAGFIVGRGWDKPETVANTVVVPADVPGDSSKAQPSLVPTDAPRNVAAPANARPVAPTAAVPAQAATPTEGGEHGAKPVPSGYERAVDSGVVIPVDAGEVFNKQIARASTADQPNQLGDAHRELEREPRDDGWAYSMEAELQNSMVNATSAGQFRTEHIECRSTICEVRVSGRGDQGDAVRAWTDTLRTNPTEQQLFLNVSSTISSHERVDAIYIFRRPAKKP